jgi:hypothetical protein
MMSNGWRRVTREKPCVICKKPDWCVVCDDESAAICMRVESDRPTKSGGWIHRLTRVGWQRDHLQRRPVKSAKRTTYTDLSDLSDRMQSQCTDDFVAALSGQLSVSTESLRLLGVGWSVERRCYSFPMFRNDGSVSGIRYRTIEGNKFTEPGGKEGVFGDLRLIEPSRMIIVEGASDVAALYTIGFMSVIGRANCVANVHQIVSMVRRRCIERVVIIPDSDAVGTAGAEVLRVALTIPNEIVRLPGGVKDVRAAISSPVVREHLLELLGEVRA